MSRRRRALVALGVTAATLVAAPLAWLLVLHLWLDSGLAARQLSRGERFRIRWTAAWSFWPGHLEVRGLELSGRAGRTRWRIDVDRASGRLDLPALRQRVARFDQVRGEGVRAAVERVADTAPGATPAAPASRPRGHGSRWRLVFPDVRLAEVREIRLPAFTVSGRGAVRGALELQPGRSAHLPPTRLDMADATFRAGQGELARHVALAVTAELGPYAPHDLPGLRSLDALSGALRADGEASPIAPLARVVGSALGARPGALHADVRVRAGRLLPGSAVRVTTGGPGGSRVELSALVRTDRGEEGVDLSLAGTDLVLGRRAPGAPTLRARRLDVAAATASTRLLDLLAAERDLRHRGAGAGTLVGDLRASGAQVAASGPRAALLADCDTLTARLDLLPLLRRELHVETLAADGVALRILPGTGAPPRRPRTAPRPWSLDLREGRLRGIRELAVAEYRLAGSGEAAASVRYADGVLAVDRATLHLGGGRLDVGGETVARELAAHADARVLPVRLGPGARPAVLRALAGRSTVAASIESLAFLDPYLARTGWLDLAGRGRLDGEIVVAGGAAIAGSTLRVRAEPVRARVLDSLATGRGAVVVAVEPRPGAGGAGAPAAVTTLRVRFDRFSLTDARRAGDTAYLRGSGLLLAAEAPGAVALGPQPLPPVRAWLDVVDAEAPDLRRYDELLPAEGGVRVLGGTARVRLHLEAESATHHASGRVVLASEDAALRFQDLELRGGLLLDAPLASEDLLGRRFTFDGARLDLGDVDYVDRGESGRRGSGWWARGQLAHGTLRWSAPLDLQATGSVTLRDGGPLLVLFGETHGVRRAMLRWLDDTLGVQNLVASAGLRLGKGHLDVERLQATSGALELRSRMSFAAAHRRSDTYLRYGHLAAGVAVRDGARTLQLRHPLEWYEAGAATWAPPR